MYPLYIDPEGGKVVICKQRIVVKSRTQYLIALALLGEIISWKVITLIDINLLIGRSAKGKVSKLL